MKAYKKANRQQYKNFHDLQILEELAAITIKPIEIIEFTNKYDPVPFPGVDVGQGISGLMKDVSDAGASILDQGSRLIENVVDQGINALSEPIKIIIIAASTIGGTILLLIVHKYSRTKEDENTNVNMAVNLQLHPHIWKENDKYYKK